MVVFSTEDQLRRLQEADTIYMDGTFTCCPQLWNQLYSLHARKDDQTYPLVYALLPDRQTTTYVRLFENLKTGTGKRYLRVYIQIWFRHACHETRDRQSRSLVSGQEEGWGEVKVLLKF